MFWRRLGAYIVDLILVGLIIIVVGMFIPQKSSSSPQMMSEIENIIKNGNNSDYEKDLEKLKDTAYEVAKDSISSSLVAVVIYFLYFAVLPFYNNGQTLGKMLTKIKIKSTKDKLYLWQTSIRGMFINSYLFSLIDVLLLIILSKKAYLNTSNTVSNIGSIIVFICFLMIIFNRGRGLHDIAASTVVVKNDEDEEEVVSSVSRWKGNENTAVKKGINSERVKNHTKRKGE